jgi:transcriptional regulator with XRE-family HTH domain
MKNTDIYIGQIIKDVMLERKVTKAELSRELGVKPQSVDYLLTRKSIDTDTLYNVSLALDYDFAQLYSIGKKQINSDHINSDFKVVGAKVSLELELKPDDIKKLDLKQRIEDALSGIASPADPTS